MSQFVLLKMDGDDQVEARMSGDVTWMELSERFVNFLQGCGYIVTGADVAAHMVEVYGTAIDDSLPIRVEDSIAEPNTITVTTQAPYNHGPLTDVMYAWGRATK